MRVLRIALLVATFGVVLVGGDPAKAQQSSEPTISIRIDKHAQVTADGGITFRLHVSCGPLPGTLDFREGFAGADQEKSGASGEGGFSPDLECDGTERSYSAGVSSITDDTFRPGPADASAAVIACNSVDDRQVCVDGAAHRRVIVRGPVPKK